MRTKICTVIRKIYGVLMTISFFAGVLPIIPFIVAICIGGSTAEAICVFLYEEYYKWVILGASSAVLLGMIGLYIAKEEGLSMKSVQKKKEQDANKHKEN